MKPYILAWILAGVLIVSAGYAYDWFPPGTGEPEDPYQIHDANQLYIIGSYLDIYMDKHIVLMADMDLSKYPAPQYKVLGDIVHPFSGTFDGNGHIVRNLTITITGGFPYAGFFGNTSNATIRNLSLEAVNISTNGQYAGGLAAYQDGGSIENCSSSGVVTSSPANGSVGGLVGYQKDGSIRNCMSTGTVSGSSEGSLCAGGITGSASGSMTYCFSEGQISVFCLGAVSYGCAGGLAGFSNDAVVRCDSSATVTCTSNHYSYTGGLVGSQGSGTVSMDFSSTSLIRDCFSTGEVNCTAVNYAFAGGFVGYTAMYSSITRCYSTGAVDCSSATLFEGGLVGHQIDSPITSCYFLVGTGPDNGYGEPLTDAEMKQRASFAGWDFVDDGSDGSSHTWRMCVDDVHYPKLSWEEGQYGDFSCPDGVGMEDLGAMACVWLIPESDPNFSYACDGSRDGRIDQEEMEILSRFWLNQ